MIGNETIGGIVKINHNGKGQFKFQLNIAIKIILVVISH